MKKYFCESITLNGIKTVLNTVELPENGKLDMPQNSLGDYVGPDGQLYYPVNRLNQTFLGLGTLRELTWHGLRNIQRTLEPEKMEEALVKTRKLHQIHEFCLGKFAYDESLAEGICKVEGLELLLEIRKENLGMYKASTEDTIIIDGTPIDRQDLITALTESGIWYAWESDQPEQRFRQGWLLQYSIISFSAAYDLQGFGKNERAHLIAKHINEGHSDDPVPVKDILRVMKTKEIPSRLKTIIFNV